jgi:hypothetical protein
MRNIDFFFGKKKGLQLIAVNGLGLQVSNKFFTNQLNRYLSQNDGYMELLSEVSHPCFSEFLSNIECEKIENIKLFARTDLNSAVKATLSCSILMDSGIITLTTQWCAYKEQRAREIISTLLVPLHLMNLQSKTFLKFNAEELEPLVPEFSDGKGYEEEIFSVFSLAQYPSYQIKDEYIASLTSASEIGSKGLPMLKAQEEHYKNNNL